MRILRAADHRRMPWKNGGGETMEIAVFPEGAGLADFDWRVSIARVDGDGPFSEFPGIDRTLSILQGAGIVLQVEGNEPRPLTVGSPPCSFPADRPTSARLIDGAIVDFNVMSRRNVLAHEVRRFTGPTSAGSEGARLVLCTGARLTVGHGQEGIALERLDALLLEAGETADLTCPAEGSGFLVTLTSKN